MRYMQLSTFLKFPMNKIVNGITNFRRCVMKTRQNSKYNQRNSKLKIYAVTRLASLLLMGGAYAGGHGGSGTLTEENREAMPHQASRMHGVAHEQSFPEGQTSEPHVTKAQVAEYKENEAEYAEAVKEAWQVNKKLEGMKERDEEAPQLEQQAQTLAQSIHHYEDKLEEAINSGVQRELVEEGISSTFSKKPSIVRQVKTFLENKEEENILCLDGGGMRGVGTLTMLAALEMKTGLRTHQLFDRIYGTSTGGLAAILLARGHTANEVLDLYLKEGEVIFGLKAWDKVTNPDGFLAAKYNPEGLESVIKKYAGDATLADVKVPVAVTIVTNGEGKTKLLSSEDEDTKDVTVLEAGRATSAAPTYFRAQKIKTKKKEYTVVDGGLGANNPTSRAYEHAKDQYKAQGRKVKINMLSLGTGQEESFMIPEDTGKAGIVSQLSDIFMKTQMQEVERTVKKLHKDGKINNYARIQFGLKQKVDLGDYSLETLQKLMVAAWNRANEKEMSDFAKLLVKQRGNTKR